MDFKPQKGSIAFNEEGYLGLITKDEPRETMISGDGSTAVVYVGIHLTDKAGNMGGVWTCYKPRVCGRLILIPGTLTYTVEAQGNGRVFLFN